MNRHQNKYVADIYKILAVGEFAFFGYTGMRENRFIEVFLAMLVMFILVFAGVLTLGVIEGDKQGEGEE